MEKHDVCVGCISKSRHSRPAIHICPLSSILNTKTSQRILPSHTNILKLILKESVRYDRQHDNIAVKYNTALWTVEA